jgi:hypothetical protein
LAARRSSSGTPDPGSRMFDRSARRAARAPGATCLRGPVAEPALLLCGGPQRLPTSGGRRTPRGILAPQACPSDT